MKKLRYLGIVALLMIGCSSSTEPISDDAAEGDIKQTEVVEHEQDDITTEADLEDNEGEEQDAALTEELSQDDTLADSVTTPEPAVTPAPTQTQEPDVTPASAQTQKPDVTPAPAQTQKPDATPAPAQTQKPDITPAPAQTPAVTQDSEPTPKPAEATPVETTTQVPEPTPEPTTEPEPAPAEDKMSIAQSHIGGSADGLIGAIGQPSSRDYAPSCNGPGDDGIFEYDGFTVYTYRENGVERVDSVE